MTGWRHIGKYRWIIEREITRDRGVGITVNYGSTGTTYGEEGENRHCFVVVFVWRPYALRVAWKRIIMEEPTP